MRGSRLGYALSHVKPLALMTLVLALMLRASVAPGYMVSASADGGFVIEICNGAETRYARLDLSTGALADLSDADLSDADFSDEDGEGAPPGDDHAGTCPFALAAAASPPPLAPAIPAPAYAPLARAFPPALSAHAAATVGAPLPARGPPRRA